MTGLLLLWTTLASGPAGASRVEWPRLHVETVTFEGLRHAKEEILLAESLLVAGRDYDEIELRDAVDRIRRLPFVVDAEMSLRKGSRRGTYELVIVVEEARRVFFDVDVLYSDFHDSPLVDDDRPIGSTTSTSLTAGYRVFPGQHGEGFAAINDVGAQFGYTHHQLFGRPWTLSVGYARRACCPLRVQPLGLDPTFGSWSSTAGEDSVSADLALHLRPRQSLRLTASYRYSREGDRNRVGHELEESGVVRTNSVRYEGFEEQRLGLAWIHDTTDHPLFATRGVLLTGALEARRISGRLERFTTLSIEQGGVDNLDLDTVSPESPPMFDAELLRASFLAGRWWPLTARQTVSARVRAAAGWSTVESLPIEADVEALDPSTGQIRLTDGLVLIDDEGLSSWELAATIRHTFKLKEAGSTHRGQIYWENTLGTAWEGTSPDLGQLQSSLRRIEVSSVVVFRTTWGVVRLGVRWTDLGTNG